MTTRKHVFYGVLALVSLLGLGITQSAKANLIVNGGFETGDFTGWTTGGNLSFTGVAGVHNGVSPHSGNFQAFLGPIGSNGFISQNLATVPGGHYVLDFSLQNDGGTPNYFSIIWGGVPFFIYTDVQAFGYTSLQYPLPTTFTNITTLEIDFRQDPAYWHLDDISVTALSTPDSGSTVVLLGVAMSVVGLLHRRIAAKRA